MPDRHGVGDRQPEPGTTVETCSRLVETNERLEHEVPVCARDAGPVILDVEQRGITGGVQAHLDVRRSVADGVAQQIVDELS